MKWLQIWLGVSLLWLIVASMIAVDLFQRHAALETRVQLAESARDRRYPGTLMILFEPDVQCWWGGTTDGGFVCVGTHGEMVRRQVVVRGDEYLRCTVHTLTRD